MNLSLIAKPLRDQDYERYLACLFEKAAHQLALYSLAAFNYELAKTAESVTEDVTGAIRLKWWHEALDEILADKAPRKHPVVEALAELPHETLKELYPLIDVRMQDIEHRQGFPNKQQFEHYLEQTAGYLHVQMARVMDDSLAEDHQGTILLAGKFYALVGLMRALPYHAERGIVRWPKDVLKQFGISPAAVEQGVEKEAFQHFVDYWLKEMAVQAEALREPIKQLPKPLQLVKRLHILALLYAGQIRQHRENLGALPARLSNLPLKLWWYEKRGFTPLAPSAEPAIDPNP